ncbi:aspartyl protease family protein [Rhizobiales bacterium GAS191]|nr:aspartyl protease family protein [Rhizobiales bacterium GAS191]
MNMIRFCILLILSVIVAPHAGAVTSPYDEDPDVLFAPVYARLGIALPTNIARDSSIWLRLDELRRETCDRVSIIGLAKALDMFGFRREAADSLYRFVLSCGGPDNALTMSADTYLKLSDFAKAVEVADALVRMKPASSNAMYLRARALDGAGNYKRALDDYATTIELFAIKKHLSSNVFVNMSKAYAALGRFCEAMSPIQTWIALDPVNRDTSQAQKMIADYSGKGNCGALEAKRPERFPLRGQTDVVVVKAEINGTKGVFVLDTGASFVSVQQEFAKRAKLPIDQGSNLTLHTANGDTSGILSKADSIKLGGLTATNVPIVVQTSREKLYGETTDGLLGMSFLARFEVQIANGYIEIRGRSSK